MSVAGKLFEDTSGKVVKVESVDGNIAHLDTGQRVAVERLLDSKFYTEHIDPDIFSAKENNFYTSLGEQLKNINTEGINESSHAGGVNISSNINPVESHTEAQRRLKGGDYTPSEEELSAIERRKREMAENASRVSSEVNKSNSKMMELIGDDVDGEDQVPVNRNLEGVKIEGQKDVTPAGNRDTEVKMYDENNQPVQSQQPQQPQQAAHPQPKREDPVYEMFNNVKRTTKFKINIKLDEKIPRKDFIKMWEDNYEKSIIDFLAEEFTQKILQDPSIIEEQIKEDLNKHVYSTRKRKSSSKSKSTKSKKPKDSKEEKSDD